VLTPELPKRITHDAAAKHRFSEELGLTVFVTKALSNRFCEAKLKSARTTELYKLSTKILVIATVGFLAQAATAGEWQSSFTPDHQGTWNIECMCIIPDGGVEVCSRLKTWDLAAGQPRHTWPQTVTGPGQTNKEIDLSSACYRKRDVDGMGGGLCCSKTDSEASKYFVGKVLNEVDTRNGGPP
jgi:hypothetical protein